MGRSKSTPGLVESKGKLVPKSSAHAREKTSASSATLLTAEPDEQNLDAELTLDTAQESSQASTLRKPEEDELSARKSSIGHHTPILSGSPAVIYAQSPHLLPPGVALVNFDNRLAPGQIPIFNPFTCAGLSPAASTQAIPTIQTDTGPDSSAGSVSITSGPMIMNQTQDALLAEIKRLRERLLTLETENASMSMKLNQQQWQVENR